MSATHRIATHCKFRRFCCRRQTADRRLFLDGIDECAAPPVASSKANSCRCRQVEYDFSLHLHYCICLDPSDYDFDSDSDSASASASASTSWVASRHVTDAAPPGGLLANYRRFKTAHFLTFICFDESSPFFCFNKSPLFPFFYFLLQENLDVRHCVMPHLFLSPLWLIFNSCFRYINRLHLVFK